VAMVELVELIWLNDLVYRTLGYVGTSKLISATTRNILLNLTSNIV